MGVWIEIIKSYAKYGATWEVTPFMGVWIEITVQQHLMLLYHRHTLYGCVD